MIKFSTILGDGLQQAINIFQYLNVKKKNQIDCLIIIVSIFSKDNHESSNKKLVILITDGSPNGLFTLLDRTPGDCFSELRGADPWLVADEFKKQGIVLAIVGIEPGVIPSDDFYCALACKTGIENLFIVIIILDDLILGGHYIPLINAAQILLPLIQTVIFGRITFYEAFLGIKIVDIEQNSAFKYSAVQQRVIDMLTECKTMGDIQKWFFNYRSFWS